MAFYIRKSFKLGPLRFNLSKSGVGVSAGVKGARIGVDARGKKYIHLGRGGIYYRRNLEDGAESAASGPGIGWGRILILLAVLFVLYKIFTL